ncbi:hypothetical protein QBC32DRAFT_335955 [Pseudoneurospora amorphoporcata]|uniref:Uncharacterized protein n=1 Tax=Pseudoneurospora amorphoporcata TaxID=241081 RepID=A0AAN6P0M5_9PEZI|nr:hypothetical protein QBC32DRAFT_335955 [Pseudoneurospora amorphoporcata]
MQTDIYIESQTYGEVDPMLISNSPLYRENYKQRDINTSILTTPLKIDYTSVFSKDGSDGALLDIHEFRLVQGKLRYAHHFTASDAALVV